jgi:hypothetical protein
MLDVGCCMASWRRAWFRKLKEIVPGLSAEKSVRQTTNRDSCHAIVCFLCGRSQTKQNKALFFSGLCVESAVSLVFSDFFGNGLWLN